MNSVGACIWTPRTEIHLYNYTDCGSLEFDKSFSFVSATTSFFALFTTGFCAYRKVADDTITMAKTVNQSMAIPNIIQHKTAVNISSKALAKVFSIELSDRKNKLTTIPMAALFNIIQITLVCAMEDRLVKVNAPVSSPLNARTIMLQMMEFKYMKTFCIII